MFPCYGLRPKHKACGFLRDALCSQHFQYESNYSHVTLGIQKLIVETETVSHTCVKKLKILWHSTWSRSDIRMEDHSIIDESMVDNTARRNCSDNVSMRVLIEIATGMLQSCVSHFEMLYSLLHNLVSRPLSGNKFTCYTMLN